MNNSALLAGILILIAIFGNLKPGLCCVETGPETENCFCSDVRNFAASAGNQSLSFKILVELCSKPEIPSHAEIEDYLTMKLDYEESGFNATDACYRLDRLYETFSVTSASSLTDEQQKDLQKNLFLSLDICDLTVNNEFGVKAKADLFRYAIRIVSILSASKQKVNN